MKVVDSDVLIRVLRGQSGAIETLSKYQAVDELACSVVTTYEVLKGCTPRQRVVTEELLRSLIQLPLTETISREAAAEYQALRQRNITLSGMDLLIGCTARVHGVGLLTGNARHYPLADLVVIAVPMQPGTGDAAQM